MLPGEFKMHTVSTSDTAAGQRTRRPSDSTPVHYDLHDTWFPVSHSRDVTSRPIRLIIHSQPYFLWRENGIPQAAEFHPSRLAALRHASSASPAGSATYPATDPTAFSWPGIAAPAPPVTHHFPITPSRPLTGIGGHTAEL